MNKQVEAIDPEALATMKKRGGTWAAYENKDLGHPDLGRLQFLRVGPGCTFEKAPERMPDTSVGLGWRYLYAGMVDLEKGSVNTEAPR